MATAHFLDKTLAAVAKVGEQAIFSERFAGRRGLLQSLDVRVKILTLLLLIIVAGLLRTVGSLWLLTFVGVLLAMLSSVPVGFFLKRVWLFVPLFTAVIVLPAIFNVITPGDPLWVLVSLPDSYAWGPYRIPRDIAVTRQGLQGGIVFISRVSASVSFAVLLMVTTRWSDILTGLRALFIPRVFLMTLSMTYRYLFLYLRLVQDMYRARKSRTIHRQSASAERNWIASRIGFLYVKSVEMSNDVYRAMLSRGYHGDVISLNRFRAAPHDYLWLAGVIIFAGFLLALERNSFR
jgi:cobalt/nickel transport system permease protein